MKRRNNRPINANLPQKQKRILPLVTENQNSSII